MVEVSLEMGDGDRERNEDDASYSGGSKAEDDRRDVLSCRRRQRRPTREGKSG